MKVSDIMTEDVVTCAPDETLHEAALKMHRENIGCCPVVDNGLVIGMLTDRDITVRAVARGDDINIKTVASVITPSPITANPDMSIEDACRLTSNKSDTQAADCRDGPPCGNSFTGEPGHRPRRREMLAETLEEDFRTKSQVRMPRTA